MDNLSHSLAGLAVGELLHRSLPQEADPGQQRIRRRLLLFTSWAASNFPDLDLVLTPVLPVPLGYLMHHRGHTHTLLYAIPQALLLWGLILLLWPNARRLIDASATARKGFFAALSIGLVLHLSMDFLNSYGIHPFHPFDSRWLYGDMVFILEPFFWIAFGVPLAMMTPPALRILSLVLLAAVPAYFAGKGFLHWSSLAALAVLAAVAGTVQYRAGHTGRRGLASAFVLAAGFIALQGVASWNAGRMVAGTLLQRDGASRVLDVALTPFPTNPVCWTFVSVESDPRAGKYALRRGVLSLAPGLLPLDHCPASRWGDVLPADATRSIAFYSTEVADLYTLRALKEGNCHFEAWLRFSRTPSVGATAATDLRYGPAWKENFTTLDFESFRKLDCPRYVPRWGFPRSDLLGP
ncbi:metal-dependent hydrolase [Noviherbaspirillum sp. ST9]|uniref:metal-dependent hydrolase n=1 Tax=Noviherbaspirillum sp. ST9 TaxID=3401606 RepID=UPI003B58A49C